MAMEYDLLVDGNEGRRRGRRLNAKPNQYFDVLNVTLCVCELQRCSRPLQAQFPYTTLSDVTPPLACCMARPEARDGVLGIGGCALTETHLYKKEIC